MESAQYTNVTETLNKSILNNMVEIKENAIMTYLDRDEDDDDMLGS